MVDVDDAHGRRLVGLATVPVVTVSPAGAPADWRVAGGRGWAPTGAGSRWPGRTACGCRCATRLAGDFNLANAALAVVALVQAGVARRRRRRRAWPPARASRAGWSGWTSGPGGPLALVDFAHTPDALERLLATARELVADGGRLVVVIGAGGDRDPHKRPAMGAIAARGADVAVLTSDNPRSEDPLAILADLRRGADAALLAGAAAGWRSSPTGVRRCGSRRAWPGRATSVVVAGKGHETGQEVEASSTRSTTGSCCARRRRARSLP